jgi:hypothetical protein
MIKYQLLVCKTMIVEGEYFAQDRTPAGHLQVPSGSRDSYGGKFGYL